MPSRRQRTAMKASPRKPSRTMRIFSWAQYCLRGGTPDVFDEPVEWCIWWAGLSSHGPTPQIVTMSPNSSSPHPLVLSHSCRCGTSHAASLHRIVRKPWAKFWNGPFVLGAQAAQRR